MAEGFVFNDGGRAAAGFKGMTGDCVARAVAIASGRDYADVYAYLAYGNKTQRKTKHSGRKPSAGVATAAHGIWTKRLWFKEYMRSLGFEWVPTMTIGSGTEVHLDANELPNGTIICKLSKHYTTMIDGIIHDTYDPRRPFVEGGKARETRAVYGYWRKVAA